METKVDYFRLRACPLTQTATNFFLFHFSVLACVGLILNSRFISNFLGECYTTFVEESVAAPRIIL